MRVEPPARLGRGVRLVGGPVGPRDDGEERRADARLAPHGDPAAQQLGQLPRQGQAQAGPLHPLLDGPFDLAEFLEDPPLVLGAIPIPVSVTEKMTVSPGPVFAASRISPRSVNFAAFERKFLRICATLPSSVWSVGIPTGSSTTRATDPCESRGCVVPRRASNRSATSNVSGRIDGLAGLDLRQVQQVVDQRREALGRLADEADFLLLLGRQLAAAAVQEEADMLRIVFSGERNSWLMFDRKRDFRSEIRLSSFAFSSSSE